MDCQNAAATVYCPIDQADVINDNVISSGDLGLTASQFGVVPAPANLDQNFDGVISSGDLGLIASFFGKHPTTDCP